MKNIQKAISILTDEGMFDKICLNANYDQDDKMYTVEILVDGEVASTIFDWDKFYSAKNKCLQTAFEILDDIIYKDMIKS